MPAVVLILYECYVIYGVVCVVVLQAFKKYEILTRKREAEIMREEETQKVEKMSQLLPAANAGKPASTEANEDELPIVVPKETQGGQEGGDREKAESGGGGKGEELEAPMKASAIRRKEKKKSPKKDSEGHQLKKERTKAFNYTSDTFNGGDMDDYKWSQTITEVEIKVALPEETTAKHVRVDIRSDYLEVEVLKPNRKVHNCIQTGSVYR